jgi:nitrogen regulatory protein PII
MKLYDLKLLVITCEILAQKNVFDILSRHQVSGYTFYEVEGNGSKNLNGKGMSSKNVKIEVILSNDKLESIVEEITRTMFSDFAIILYVGDAGVIRSEKFI